MFKLKRLALIGGISLAFLGVGTIAGIAVNKAAAAPISNVQVAAHQEGAVVSARLYVTPTATYCKVNYLVGIFTTSGRMIGHTGRRSAYAGCNSGGWWWVQTTSFVRVHLTPGRTYYAGIIASSITPNGPARHMARQVFKAYYVGPGDD